MSEERAHRVLSASKAPQWVNCPGSFFYYQDLPKDEGSVHADAGNRYHEIVEILLHDFLEHKITGSDPEVRAPLIKGDPRYTQEMIDYAFEAVDVIWDKVFDSAVTGKIYGFEDDWELSKEYDIGGFTDLWVIEIDDRAKRVGHILDHKYGYHEVEITSDQLKVYASGLQEEMTLKGKALDRVVVHIYQPRCRGEAYKSHSYTAKELETFKKKCFSAAEQIFVKQIPKFKIGSWCKWCKAQAKCVTYNKEVMSKHDLMLVDTKATLPTPESMSDESIAKIVLNADMLNNFVKACKAYATRRFIDGSPIPGTKVVENRGKRKWANDSDLELAELFESKGVVEPYTIKLRGITALTKELGKQMPKKEAEALVDSFCDRRTGKPKLVSEDDPRPAVQNLDDLLLEENEDE